MQLQIVSTQIHYTNTASIALLRLEKYTSHFCQLFNNLNRNSTHPIGTFTLTMATQGFGCMGLSAFYSSAKDVTPEKAKTVIHHAVNKGFSN